VPEGDVTTVETFAWAAFGIAATAIFYSRFYLQWLVSEIKRRSVVPEFFWYQSAVGSIMMLILAYHQRSPLGALSHSLNVVPYTRNLVHIWREKGRLTPAINWIATTGALAIAFGAVVVVLVWRNEIAANAGAADTTARTNWIWLGIGVLGQFLFGCRFLVQWALTEWHRRSIVPAVFWQISFVAALLQIASYAQRREWFFIIGTTATLFIYARNLWFIHFGNAEAVLSEKG
jgi:lipid-A-disaccharide synthase-like uncharacterized protein